MLLLLLYPNASCQRWPAFAMAVILARMAAAPRFAPSGNPLPARLGTAFSAPGVCGGAGIVETGSCRWAISAAAKSTSRTSDTSPGTREIIYIALTFPSSFTPSGIGDAIAPESSMLETLLPISSPAERDPSPTYTSRKSAQNLVQRSTWTTPHLITCSSPPGSPGTVYIRVALSLSKCRQTLSSRLCASEDQPSIAAFRPPFAGPGHYVRPGDAAKTLDRRAPPTPGPRFPGADRFHARPRLPLLFVSAGNPGMVVGDDTKTRRHARIWC